MILSKYEERGQPMEIAIAIGADPYLYIASQVRELDLDVDEMALASMKEALEEIRARWDVTAAFLHHRLGRVEVGETSVVAVVSAPHREDAFAACRYLIERLKKDIPIWKREATDEGTRWVGTPPPDPER